MLLVLQITEICCPLQKTLHDPVGSMQTIHGSWNVCLGVRNHRPPSSISSFPFRPAGHLLTGNTDPSQSAGHKGLGSGSIAGIDEHTSTREGWWNYCRLIFDWLSNSLNVSFAYHHIFARTLACHSNSHPLIVYFSTIEEL